jgi:hypothetical protein
MLARAERTRQVPFREVRRLLGLFGFHSSEADTLASPEARLDLLWTARWPVSHNLYLPGHISIFWPV